MIFQSALFDIPQHPDCPLQLGILRSIHYCIEIFPVMLIRQIVIITVIADCIEMRFITLPYRSQHTVKLKHLYDRTAESLRFPDIQLLRVLLMP